MTSTDERVSMKPWSDFPASAYTPAEWRAACLIDKGTGDPDSKDRYSLPVREPSGALNTNGMHAAAARIGMVACPPEKKATAARALVRLYSQCNQECPDEVKTMANGGEPPPEQRARGPVEERAARIDNVDFAERILTVIAVPFEVPTQVPYRGEVWQEVFTRSAFNGFEPSKRRVPVSAVLKLPAIDHNDGHLVGKVVGTYPERSEGLILDMHIANTPHGSETLELANNDMLSPSVGFAVRGSDQELDRRTMRRRVNRAFLDHVSMVPHPAYLGAKVLSVRDDGGMVSSRELPPLNTPSLDDFLADPVMNWAQQRLNREV